MGNKYEKELTAGVLRGKKSTAVHKRSRLASDCVVYCEFILSDIFKMAPFEREEQYTGITHNMGIWESYSLLSASCITRVH